MNDMTKPAAADLPVAALHQHSLAPRTMEEALTFAKRLACSELVPKDFRDKEANVFVAVQWGFELGLQPMQALQSIAVINGRPSLWGDAVLALVRASGLCEYVREEISDDSATCYTKRRGEDEVSRTFTLEDAKKAKLAEKDGPWKQYTKRMLQMRARSWCLRDVYPDVLRGVQVAEESRDIEPEKDVTDSGTHETVDRSTGEITMPERKSAPPSAKPAVKDAEVVVAPKTAAAPPAPEKREPPAPTGDFATPASEGQVKHIRKKMEAAGITEAEVFKAIGIDKLDGITVGTGNMILQFLTDPAAYGAPK